MLKTKILKDTFFLNLSAMIGQGFKVLQGFLILKFLDPAAYGVWLSLEIMIRYSAYIHLGLEYGFSNRLPYYMGQDKPERVRDIQDTTYAAWTCLAALFTIGILVYSFTVANVTAIYKWGLVIIAFLILSEQQITYLSRWITSGKKNFFFFSRMQVLKTIVAFFLIVPLAYFFNVTGLMLGTLLTSIVLAVMWWKTTDFRFRKNVRLDVLKELFTIGFPILLTAIGGVLIETVDRLLILNQLGQVQLGYYGVTVLGGSFLYGILAQAGSTMLPHMVEDIGREKDDPRCLQKYLIKPTLLFASISMLIILALEFIIPLIVTYWVPKYLPGLPAFTYFIPGYFFVSVILAASNIMQVVLVVKKRLRWMVYIQFSAVLVEVLFGLLFLGQGFGIPGVALASTLSYAFYGIIVLSLATHSVLETTGQKVRFLGEVAGLFLTGAALFILFKWVGQILAGDQLIFQVIIQLVFCALAGIPLLFWLDKRVNIMPDVLAFISGLKAKYFPGAKA